MSHTPGPWKVGKVNHKKQRVDIDTDASDIRTGYYNWQGFDLLDTTKDVAKKHGLTYSNLESLNATADAAIRLATGDE